MNIGVIASFRTEEKRAYAEQVVEKLKQYGVNPMLASKDQAEPCIAESDVVVSLGGDGTMLRMAKIAARYNKPLLGINCGHLGFMTGLEMDELSALEVLTRGEWQEDVRMMLEIRIQGENGESIHTTEALNELAISRGVTGHIAQLCVKRDGDEVAKYLADGLLISTPTGSTAYSLSAGGPVIDPAAHCMVLTPICPHSLESRSYVFDENATLTIEAPVSARGEMAYWSADGEDPRPLEQGQVIQIRRSERAVRLIHLKQYSFYDVLHTKMLDRATR